MTYVDKGTANITFTAKVTADAYAAIKDDNKAKVFIEFKNNNIVKMANPSNNYITLAATGNTDVYTLSISNIDFTDFTEGIWSVTIRYTDTTDADTGSVIEDIAKGVFCIVTTSATVSI